VFLKSIDFSLLGVIREMLYVPLKLDEKFRAKAIIDVFAYRSAKAIVSLGTLILQLVAGIYLLKITALISICVFVGWLVMLTVFLRKQIPTSVQ
jgi:ATP/ADP translocase